VRFVVAVILVFAAFGLGWLYLLHSACDGAACPEQKGQVAFLVLAVICVVTALVVALRRPG
jgi:hypothetical protein